MKELAQLDSDMKNLCVRVDVEARRHGVASIGVIGTHAGAGTSTICQRLSRAFVGEGRVVMVIDADLHSPDLHRKFSIEGSPGAAEVAAGDSTLLQALNRVGDNLFVLPGGSWRNGAGSSTEAWSDLVREARGAADLLLFDLGAVETANTAVVGAALDGAIIVAEAGRSRWEQIDAVAEYLERLRVKLLGVVLNRRRYPIPNPVYRRL